MTAKKKIAFVVAGYLAALLIACAAIVLNHAFTSAADRDVSSGMSAFGDAILFMGVFVLCSTAVSVAGIASLRSHPTFWRGLGIAVPLIVALPVLAGFLLFGA